MTIHQEVVEDVNVRSGIDRAGSFLGRRVCVLSLFFAAVGVFLALVPAPARAQALDLTTPYPEMSVQPGQTVTLDLEVRTTELGRVSLKATEVPEGWSAVIRGGGQAVSAVFPDPEDAPALDLEVDVPADAAPGGNRLVVQATQGGSSVDLPLTLTVAEEATGGTAVETEFPSLRGPSDATFSFSIDLRNSAPEMRTYNISAQAPEGWQISLVPSGTDRETPTVTVEANSSQRLSLEVTPPATVEPGDYPVTVRAATSGEEEVLELGVTITGTYDLSITTPQERLNATIQAGGTTEVPLIVTNQGTGPVAGVSLSAVPPTEWTVSFEPEVLDEVPGGESVPVTALFEPAEGAIAGDYIVTLRAEGDQDAAEADFRVTVETSTLWGLVGVAVIVLALVGLVLVFRRYGRR